MWIYEDNTYVGQIFDLFDADGNGFLSFEGKKFINEISNLNF